MADPTRLADYRARLAARARTNDVAAQQLALYDEAEEARRAEALRMGNILAARSTAARLNEVAQTLAILVRDNAQLIDDADVTIHLSTARRIIDDIR